MNGANPFGMADSILASYVRIMTHRGIYPNPPSQAEAVEDVKAIRARPNCVPVNPGARHWEIFTDLLTRTGVRGADVTDAWIAALAIESGSRLMTADGEMGRFPGLKWAHPLK